MADKTIGNLTAASALDGTEAVEVEQGSNSRKTTVQDIADRFAATPSAGRDALELGSISTADVTVSTSDPSGGSNGDIWLKVE